MIPPIRSKRSAQGAATEALIERLLTLLDDCRGARRDVENDLRRGDRDQATQAQQVDRLASLHLVNALVAGLQRTTKNTLTALAEASWSVEEWLDGYLQRQQAATNARLARRARSPQGG